MMNRWYRNINLFAIAYAFRPRLRDRLTLSRLALLRNPWAYGERVFHPLYRYSMSAWALVYSPAVLTVDLQPVHNAPLPLISKRYKPAASDNVL